MKKIIYKFVSSVNIIEAKIDIMNSKLIVGDRFDGVLLETIKMDGTSRPRVRPIQYFDDDIKVEFPRNLREQNPIGTRFRADVKVSQKTKNGEPFGNPYLVATDSSIVKIESYVPNKIIHAVKLNTASDKVYEYIEKVFKMDPALISFEDFRKYAYENMINTPKNNLSNQIHYITRSELIKTYALTRAKGKCEACETDAPFLRKNEQPYLEVHHLLELKNGGSDSPLNVSAICPNCHARVSYGLDGNAFNEKLIKKIQDIESKFDKQIK